MPLRARSCAMSIAAGASVLRERFRVMNIEVVPSTRPSIITLEVPGEDVQTAFDAWGESLREPSPDTISVMRLAH